LNPEQFRLVVDAPTTRSRARARQSNVAFSQSVDPKNARIKELAKRCETEKVTTCKSNIGDELEWNVFMRLGSEAVRSES